MKKAVLAGIVALGLAQPALADTIQFDTNGAAAGGLVSADLFDWKPGNSLLIENAGGTKGTILYQANLSIIDTPGVDFANGANGYFYTAVAGFGIDITPTGPTSSDFSFDATNTTNFFKIYVTTTPTVPGNGANDLTGSCFVCGTEILSGHAVPTGFAGNFSFFPAAGTMPLDQFGINDYPGVSTFLGVGSTKVNVVVDSVDTSYFVSGIDAGTTMAFSNTSTIDPYSQANPAAKFTNDGVTDANENGVSAVGATNGLGTTIITQADANTSFVGVVPEPASITLMGLGLLGVAAAARRRQKA